MEGLAVWRLVVEDGRRSTRKGRWGHMPLISLIRPSTASQATDARPVEDAAEVAQFDVVGSHAEGTVTLAWIDESVNVGSVRVVTWGAAPGLEIEDPIDYGAAASVLREAGRVDEVESPVGGTPFGA